jgi:hypothetical protein
MPPIIQEPLILSTLPNPFPSINLDALSTYTADGDGEEDDEEEIEDVSDILVSYDHLLLALNPSFINYSRICLLSLVRLIMNQLVQFSQSLFDS